MAAASLYLDNPFRILGLPTSAPMPDVRRRSKELVVEAQLDGAEPEAVHRIRDAAAQVEDSVRRLEHELYWFMLPPELVPRHAVADAKERRAVAGRLQRLVKNDNDHVALHDLAVLRHCAAIEAASGSAVQCRPALEAWASTWRSDRFWMHVRLRARELQDKRVTDQTVTRVREQLPARVLAATATHVSRLLGSGADERAREALAAVTDSPFPAADVRKARSDATAQLLTQATDLLTSLRGAAGTAGDAPAVAVKTRLIPTARRLKALDAANPSLQQALDDIAEHVRALAVRLYNETSRFDTVLPLTTAAVDIAASDHVRQRAEADLRALHTNRFRKALDEAGRSAQAGNWDGAAAAIRQAREWARSDDDRKGVEELVSSIHNAAATASLTLAGDRRWQQAVEVGRVARRFAPDPVREEQWDANIARWIVQAVREPWPATPAWQATTASPRRTSGCAACAGWVVWLVVVLLIVGAANGMCNSSRSSGAIQTTTAHVQVGRTP